MILKIFPKAGRECTLENQWKRGKPEQKDAAFGTIFRIKETSRNYMFIFSPEQGKLKIIYRKYWFNFIGLQKKTQGAMYGVFKRTKT